MTATASTNDPRVAVFRGAATYSEASPFHPAARLPEYPFGNELGPPNPAYIAVRRVLEMLGLDRANFGTAYWNPLGELIRRGDRVLVKPNFIAGSHATRPRDWDYIITHPSVIRAVLDYVFIALEGKGEVTIADGPQTDSDFDTIRERVRLDEICSFFNARGLIVRFLDLRREHWHQVDGVTTNRTRLAGDPEGYARIDLGQMSEFNDYRLSGRFYGADYDTSQTARFHDGRQHTYIISRTALDTDVFINLPKLKTHKKTGVTLSLKNLVGIVGHRNCLPHHTMGMPDAGGDEAPAKSVRRVVEARAITAFRKHLTNAGGCGGPVARFIIKCGRPIFGDASRVIRSGNWYGNDTAWRMAIDINKALFHFSGSARSRLTPLRYFTLVDGIIGAEGNGPVMADPKYSGFVVAGFNPVAVDTVCAEVMGFDYEKLPLLKQAWQICEGDLVGYKPSEIVCRSNISDPVSFLPPRGWQGHIEKELSGAVAQ